MGRSINALPEPIAVAVGAGRRTLKARGARPTGHKIGKDDPVPFGKRLAQAIPLHLLPQAVDFSHHFMTKDTEETGRDGRAMAAPHVQIGAADVGAADFDQEVLRSHLGHGIFSNL